MKENPYKITVELPHGKSNESYKNDVVEINLNQEGIDYLISRLSQLKLNGDHIHLMTGEWGMDDLEGKAINKKGSVVHHLEIIKNEDF